MAQERQFFIKETEREHTNWLWIVNKDYSGLVGWYRHYHGIKIVSFNQFYGMVDFKRKGYRPATQEAVNEILSALVKWLADFIEQAEFQRPAA